MCVGARAFLAWADSPPFPVFALLQHVGGDGFTDGVLAAGTGSAGHVVVIALWRKNACLIRCTNTSPKLPPVPATSIDEEEMKIIMYNTEKAQQTHTHLQRFQQSGQVEPLSAIRGVSRVYRSARTREASNDPGKRVGYSTGQMGRRRFVCGSGRAIHDKARVVMDTWRMAMAKRASPAIG